MPAADRKIRLAILGTGDVAYRHYLPALAAYASIADGDSHRIETTF